MEYHLGKSGSGNFIFRQTLFKPIEEIKEAEPVRKGHGGGSFIVVRATRIKDCKSHYVRG